MKKGKQDLVAILLAIIFVFSFTACGDKAETYEKNVLNAKSQAQSVEKSATEKTGLWENATYLTDTEVGQGPKNFTLEVKANNQFVKFTVHTDEKTVGSALLNNGLIAGDKSEYGIYVKVVNGMTADYDIDQSYWAFYINGEYATTGVDSTDITEGVIYSFVYTK